MLPSHQWTELTSADIESANMAGVIGVLPVAAIEQHGPHLPLGTDTYIMEGYIARVLSRMPQDLPAVFLPIQRVGHSVEHGDFPGTLSLPARYALEMWGGLIDTLVRVGCRKVVIVNSHGGNSSLVELLARDARARHGVFIGVASWQRFGYPAGLFSDAEQEHGIHGGQIETALMLAFRPDLVRMDLAANFESSSASAERKRKWLRVFGRPTGFGWMAQDLNASGAVGDAAGATAAMGEACAEFGADAFVDYLREVRAFELARLVTRPTRR